MKMKRISIEPELILLGRYSLQGFAGGLIAAMALMLLYLIRGLTLGSFIVVFWGAVPMVVAGVLGVFKAIPFWAVNCFKRSPLRARTRIILGGIVSTSLWVFLLIREGAAPVETLVLSSIVVFLLSLPTSLLIGSRVRAGRFFTSGSIGGLPLRLISTGGLLFCVLAVACWQLLGEDVQQDIMFRYFPLLYFSLSLYLTFRPPRKAVLLITALGLNVPLVLALRFGDKFQTDYGWVKGESTALFILCLALLTVWAFFITTQPNVASKKALRAESSYAMLREADSNYQCLGSRFAEWQQRVV